MKIIWNIEAFATKSTRQENLLLSMYTFTLHDIKLSVQRTIYAWLRSDKCLTFLPIWKTTKITRKNSRKSVFFLEVKLRWNVKTYVEYLNIFIYNCFSPFLYFFHFYRHFFDSIVQVTSFHSWYGKNTCLINSIFSIFLITSCRMKVQFEFYVNKIYEKRVKTSIFFKWLMNLIFSYR